MEEQIVSRVKRHAEFPGPREGLGCRRRFPSGRQLSQGLLQEEGVPLRRKRAGHQDVIVLEEFSEGDENLAEIRDDADMSGEPLCGRGVRHFDEVARVQDDERPFDRVAGRDRARLSGTFRLDLSPDRDEVVEDVHRRGMQGHGSETRGPGAAVPETKAAGPARMAEDGPPGHNVLDEHLARLDAGVLRDVVGSRVLLLHVGIDELPTVDPQLSNMFLDLRGLEAHPVRDDEARAAANPVRLDSGQVSEAADLRVLRPFAVDRHGAVRDDERDLLVGGGVLEVLDLLVQGDFLLEALDLFPRRLVTADAEFPPDDVRDEDAQGLAGPAGGTNRSCVGQVHVRAAVPVPFDLHRGEAFQGGDENSFRQDREAHSDRPFHGPLLARRGPHGHLLRHEDGKFLAVVDLRQLPDPSGDTLDLVVFQEPFHSGCEVVRDGDLHIQLGIEPASPRGTSDRVRRVDQRREALKVGADLLGNDGRTHSIPSMIERGPRIRRTAYMSLRPRACGPAKFHG